MRIYVGNVPYQSSEQDLRAHFETVGRVDKVDVVMDRDSGRPRGFVFVDMDDAGGQRAISELNESQLSGRRLIVNPAKDKPRAGGFDNRSRGRGGRDDQRRRDDW